MGTCCRGMKWVHVAGAFNGDMLQGCETGTCCRGVKLGHVTGM